MSPAPRSLSIAVLGGLAVGLAGLAVVLSTAAAPGDDVSVQPQVAEHRLFAPGLVAEAEGTYAPHATATPAPTVVGVQDAPNRLFVAFAGDDAGEGTRDEPFATIAHALEVAREIDDAEIYVDTTTQYLESIAIVEQSVKLFGGYSASTWERVPELRTVILPIEPHALTIAISSDVVVEGFELRSGSSFPAAPLHRSRIPVVIEVSNGVVFRDNVVIAADGRNGTPGEHGVSGAQGSDGHDGDDSGVCPPTNQGGSGGAGAATGGRGGNGSAVAAPDGSDGNDISAAIDGGSGGSGGGFPAGVGGNGGPGDDGTSFVDRGVSGGPIGFFGFEGYEPADGEDGVSTRLGGAGGGGGGGEGGGLFFICGGGGGGGGGGGFPAQSDGLGGQSGGGSFGVFIQLSEVELADNEITTGNGGTGGRGGDAAAGGFGGDGGAGGGNAGHGGGGGRGGPSAPGGGGGGGPSIGIIADPDSIVISTGNTFSLGQGGEGGDAGFSANLSPQFPPGATGLRLEFYQDVPDNLSEPPQPTN